MENVEDYSFDLLALTTRAMSDSKRKPPIRANNRPMSMTILSCGDKRCSLTMGGKRVLKRYTMGMCSEHLIYKLLYCTLKTKLFFFNVERNVP